MNGFLHVWQLESDFVIFGVSCWLNSVVLGNIPISLLISSVRRYLASGHGIAVWATWLKAGRFINPKMNTTRSRLGLDTVSAPLGLHLRGHRFNSHSSYCVLLPCPGARGWVSASSLSPWLRQLREVWTLWPDWSSFCLQAWFNLMWLMVFIAKCCRLSVFTAQYFKSTTPYITWNVTLSGILIPYGFFSVVIATTCKIQSSALYKYSFSYL